MDTFSELEKMILRETANQIYNEFMTQPVSYIVISKRLKRYVNYYNHQLNGYFVLVNPEFDTLEYVLMKTLPNIKEEVEL